MPNIEQRIVIENTGVREAAPGELPYYKVEPGTTLGTAPIPVSSSSYKEGFTHRVTVKPPLTKVAPGSMGGQSVTLFKTFPPDATGFLSEDGDMVEPQNLKQLITDMQNLGYEVDAELAELLQLSGG